MHRYFVDKLISGDFDYLRSLTYIPDHRYIVEAILYNPLLSVTHIPMTMELIGYAFHVYFHTPKYQIDDSVTLEDISMLEDIIPNNRNLILANTQFGILLAENFVIGSFAPSEILETFCNIMCPDNKLAYYTTLLDNSSELRCILENH